MLILYRFTSLRGRRTKGREGEVECEREEITALRAITDMKI